MSLSTGTRLGPYIIEATIGTGGMGEVYKAHDLRLARAVAIKVLASHLIESSQARQWFAREARTVASLQHSNICTIYDVGETADGHAFLVMELLQGETLQQRLTEGPLDVAQQIELAIALADALACAHGVNIVHRDIKPANIMLTAGGPKILDFGLAKSLGQTAATSANESTMTAVLRTDPGTAVGTLAYMSPEQLRAEDVDARTDLFSFGVVLYEMATGRRAFAGSTSAHVAAAVLHEDPPRPRTLRPELPESLEGIVLKAIEKDRGLRYQRADDIRTDLQRLKRDRNVTAAPVVNSRATRSHSVGWKLAAAAALAAVAVAAYLMVPRRPTLTVKDTLVLAEFVNTTGDPVFDGTLRQGLAVQLEQSPFLSLISEQRIQRTLGLMGQPPTARLTPEVARQVCERTASTAVVEGSIAILGSQYVLGLRATHCRTGDVLDEEQVQAARKEDVLNALSRLVGAFRSRAGESLATIQNHDKPLKEATTPSLEALKAYSAAYGSMTTGSDFASAVALFKHAIEIDPQFAMAYASLGFTYGLMGQPTLSAEAVRKAFDLRDRVSDRERFFISANYELQVTGNLERALEICESWARSYPRDIQPYGILGAFLYPTYGRFDKGAEAANHLVEIDPDFVIGYLQLEFNHQFAGRLQQAEDALRLAAERKLEIPELAVQRYDLAFLKGDRTALEREVAVAASNPEAGDLVAGRQGFVLAYSGRLQAAEARARQTADQAQPTVQPGRAALWMVGPALWNGFFGNNAAAIRDAAAALELSKDRDVEYGAGFALALAGDAVAAETVASDLSTRFPDDSAVKFTYVPTIRALLALNRQDPTQALDLLQPTVPYELGTPLCSAPAFFGILYPVYARGLAYLSAQRGASAAAEFHKILDRPFLVVSDPIRALAHLQLGRALAQSGDPVKARAAYREFLMLWKDADSNLPILQQAKSEYARLQ